MGNFHFLHCQFYFLQAKNTWYSLFISLVLSGITHLIQIIHRLVHGTDRGGECLVSHMSPFKFNLIKMYVNMRKGIFKYFHVKSRLYKHHLNMPGFRRTSTFFPRKIFGADYNIPLHTHYLPFFPFSLSVLHLSFDFRCTYSFSLCLCLCPHLFCT